MKKVVMLFAVIISIALTSVVAFAHDAEVTLTAENNSGQNGSAELTDMGNGTTRVVLAISSTSSVPQPAHIHNGTCATLDPKPAYPLSNVVDGKSETIVNETVKELLASPYAINVHKSGTEASVYVSCGNIVAAMDADSGNSASPGMPTTGGGDRNLVLAALTLLGLGITATGFRLARRKA